MKKEKSRKILQIIISTLLLVIAFVIDKNTNWEVWQDLCLYLAPYLISGFDVLKEAAEKILKGELFDEDFLMSIATIGAFSIGFLPNKEPEFEEAVFVMLFYQVGELFEMIAEGNSERAIESLMDIRPDVAYIKRDDKIIKVDPKTIKINDEIIVTPGKKIPMDGVVTDGKSSLNTVAITGESIPRDVKKGDFVISGCVNLTGILTIRVTKTFGESTASKIIDLVRNAPNKKAQSENFISKFSKIYTPIVCIIAVTLAIVMPLISGNFAQNFATWFSRALTFLVVSCPCALVISVPLSFFGGIGGASKRGILIKGSNYIENLTKVKTIIFDKTGTLTEGVFEVVAVHPEIFNEDEILHLASHVERYSTHPIAMSLKRAYKKEKDNCKVSEVEEIAGNGIKAKVNGKEIYVGNDKLMKEMNIPYKECKNVGTIVHVAYKEKYLGHIVISDKIKPDSKEGIKKLKSLGINVVMLSGDKNEVAKDVASKIGIENYYGELLPQDKVAKLDQFMKNKSHDGKIAFAGDGINDAISLERADVGIAMGGIGTDVAIEAADVVIMNDKISKIFDVINISKRTMRIAKENIIFAIAIKILVLILASFGIAKMWMAVFADVGVTIIDTINAMRTLKPKNDWYILRKNENSLVLDERLKL